MTDISKDAVERHILRIDPSNLAQDRSLNSDTFIILRAQSVRIAELEAERVKDHANINLKADWIDRTMNDMALDNERIAELEAACAALKIEE